jgi:hypothetical protein
VLAASEVEQPMREIGHQRAFIDEKPRQNGVALLFERAGFPPNLPRIGDHAAADAQVGGLAHDDARREQVELDATGRVTGVRAAVHLQDDGNGSAGVAQFFGDLGDKTAFAFVAEGNADVGDELAGERKQGHGACGNLSPGTPVAGKGKRECRVERNPKFGGPR